MPDWTASPKSSSWSKPGRTMTASRRTHDCSLAPATDQTSPAHALAAARQAVAEALLDHEDEVLSPATIRSRNGCRWILIGAILAGDGPLRPVAMLGVAGRELVAVSRPLPSALCGGMLSSTFARAIVPRGPAGAIGWLGVQRQHAGKVRGIVLAGKVSHVGLPRQPI